MSYLTTDGSKSNSRISQSSTPRGRLVQGAGAYNPSSLAFDVQENEAVLEWKQPKPRLVPPSPSASGALRRKPMFVSLDVATARKDPKSKAISLVLHAAIVGFVLWWGMAAAHVVHTNETVVKFTLFNPPPPKIMPVAKPAADGGGGVHKVAPPVKAQAPKLIVPHVHMLPPEIASIEHPKLAMEPNSQVNMQVASNMPTMGMPDSPQIALASQAPGTHGGFGSGMGGGIGMGSGGGGGFGGGVMSVGGGVSAPEVIHSVEPEFTDQARRANLQGTVSIQLIVDSQGNPQDVRVLRHLGMGLDQKAVDAVRQYKFSPAMYQGHPVAVQLVIEVEFRLH